MAHQQHITGETQQQQAGFEVTESADALRRIASMNIVVLGLPGSGKTTLTENLQDLNPDINYISVGEISRNLPPESPQS